MPRRSTSVKRKTPARKSRSSTPSSSKRKNPQKRSDSVQKKNVVAKKTDRYTVLSTTQSNIPLFQFTTSYIDEKKLKSAVQDYKYVSPTTTILERLFLIKYWNWLATQYPKWLAPNVITLTGFAAFVCPLFVAMYNGYLMGNGETPNWFLLLACVCQFIYQSADGSDGPQARRLKCGSALGELVDHGADAIISCLFSLSMAELTGIGMDSMYFPLLIIGAQMAFICSNTTLLHKGSQAFSQLDAQEAQVLGQVMLFFVFVWNTVHETSGRVILETRVPLPDFFCSKLLDGLTAVGLESFSHGVDVQAVTADGVQVRWLLVAGAIYSTWKNALFDLIRCYSMYWSDGKSDQYAVGKGRKSLWNQALSFLVWNCIGMWSWHELMAHSGEEYFTSLLLPWFLAWAASYGDFCNHFLVIRVTRIPFHRFYRHRAFLWMVAIGLALHYSDPANMVWTVRCLSIAAILSHLHFCMSMGGKIGDALNVPFFIVKSKA